jgi:sugar diacid utilization regulator
MRDTEQRTSAQRTSAGRSAASPLDALAEAVESGAGLPDLARAAAAALGASVALIDARQAVLAVAASTPSVERELLCAARGVTSIDLRVADANVGQLRFRPRAGAPDPSLVRMVTTLLALEMERTRAPEQAGEAALGSFVNSLLDGEIADRRDLSARAKELGVDLERGMAVAIVRLNPRQPADGDWQARALTVAGRAARSVAAGTIAALRGEGLAILVPGEELHRTEAAARSVHRSLQDSMSGFAVAIGVSRVTTDPMDLHRAGAEALLAANVAAPDDSGEGRILNFDNTGAYRLLLPAMSEDPAELERFYSETVAPLAAYDEQYGTELVTTLEAFLANDASMAATHRQLFTHRHTIRYRLDRIKELTGLDVNSTDGRERLGLGLKAMRVLGKRAPTAPVFEPGAKSGRVPKRNRD